MSRLFHRTTLIAIFLAIAVPFIVQAAGNLIVNGTFDADVANWTPENSTVTITHDAGNQCGQVTNKSGAGSTTTRSAQQCINISADSPFPPASGYWTLKGDISVPLGSLAQEAFLRFAYYGSTDCGGSQLATHSTTSVTPGNASTERVTVAHNAGASSVEVRLAVRKPGSTGDATACFDNVQFFSSTSNAVTLTSLSATTINPTILALPLFGLLALGAGAYSQHRRTH